MFLIYNEKYLAVISNSRYVDENFSDAEMYFSQAVEAHPNNYLGYLNRSVIYRIRENNQEELKNITSAINNGASLSAWRRRSEIYLNLEEYGKAEQDIDKVLSSEYYKRDATVYAQRAIIKILKGEKDKACKDIEIAYNLTNDKDLEAKLQKLWNECVR